MFKNCCICERHVHSHSFYLTCSICHESTHLNCLPLVEKRDPLYTQRHLNNWYCTACVQSILPFNHFNDDDDFKEALNECFYEFTANIHVNDRILDVFDYNDDNDNSPMLDIDPDNNFYNQCSKQCNYYSINDLHKNCKAFDSTQQVN